MFLCITSVVSNLAFSIFANGIMHSSCVISENKNKHELISQFETFKCKRSQTKYLNKYFCNNWHEESLENENKKVCIYKLGILLQQGGNDINLGIYFFTLCDTEGPSSYIHHFHSLKDNPNIKTIYEIYWKAK